MIDLFDTLYFHLPTWNTYSSIILIDFPTFLLSLLHFITNLLLFSHIIDFFFYNYSINCPISQFILVFFSKDHSNALFIVKSLRILSHSHRLFFNTVLIIDSLFIAGKYGQLFFVVKYLCFKVLPLVFLFTSIVIVFQN